MIRRCSKKVFRIFAASDVVRSRETLFLFAKKPIDIANINTRSDRKCCHALRIFAIPKNSLGGRISTQSWSAASRGLLADDSF